MTCWSRRTLSPTHEEATQLP